MAAHHARRLALTLISALGGAVVTAQPALASTATLTGAIACEHGHQVTGLYIHSSAGGSKWATLSGTTAPWLRKYTVSLPVPTTVRYDIGCGLNADGSWYSNNRTGTRAISGTGTLSAACREAAGTAQRCGWWGATVFVGMPFSGVLNKYGLAYPASHPCYDDGAASADSCVDTLGYADWSTDIFVGEGVPVRPRIYAPINNSTYVLRIRSVSTGCAGKSVHVGIYRNGNLIGDVSYAHLANVPSFTNGQPITTGTTLGTLRWWSNCRSYSVSSVAGTHTHVEVGTVNGIACYLPWGKATAYQQTRIIGKVLPGATALCT